MLLRPARQDGVVTSLAVSDYKAPLITSERIRGKLIQVSVSLRAEKGVAAYSLTRKS